MNAAPRRQTRGVDAVLEPEALEGEPAGCPLCGAAVHRRTCPASDEVNEVRDLVTFQ